MRASGNELKIAMDELAAAMAIRDLMSATITLSELPVAQLQEERSDIELVHNRLIRLLMKIEDVPA